MTQPLRDFIIASVPKDGSSISTHTLLSLFRETFPGLPDDDYVVVTDALVAESVLGMSSGSDDELFLRVFEHENARNDEGVGDGDFSLSAQQPPVSPGPKVKGKSKSVRKVNGPMQVLSYRHGETRVNNPEVGMVHPDNDPDQPKTVWKYDPHLDPELMFDSQRGAVEKLIDDALASDDTEAMRDALVELKRLQEPYLNWAGKAEGTSFAVDTVSLHVHERVDPATILANARKRFKGEKASEIWRQADLFSAAFENLPLRQALDFYHHEKGWSNRLIAGDSLLVMNSLLHKESMAGMVQTIYIDPPYGIKYGSNFQPFVNKKPNAGQDKDEDLTSEPEMIRAFRDTWALGEHSYLTYLSHRIKLSFELLAESGSIFIQISQTNEHRVRLLLDEIFGAKNYVETIAYRTKNMTLGGELLEGVFDYIIWYAKDKKAIKFNRLFGYSDVEGDSHWNYYNLNGSIAQMSGEQVRSHRLLPDGADPVQLSALYPTGVFETGLYEFNFRGLKYTPPSGRCWKSPRSGMERLAKASRIVPYDSGKTIRYALRLSDYPISPLHNIWADTAPASNKTYVVQTAHKVIERCILMTSDPGDLVFDPTCGSGTTAFVAEKWGRRWITCDTSRVALNLARQRLLTSNFEYYSLRYPTEGLKGGFSYQNENHITLKSITNNPDVDEIYRDKHPAMEVSLNALNAALRAELSSPFVPTQGIRKGKEVVFTNGHSLEEWEVPLAWPDEWPRVAATAFEGFHDARRAMQAEMDRSIAAHAEQETLYDKPHVDKSRLRITGPFSVEAVPAPTVLSLDEAAPPEQADATVARSGETSRQSQWRDELIRTGIRAKNNAMLKFIDLEAIPGVKHLHASGSLDSGERIVVSFGPEHAALEQRQVEMALGEAEKLRPAPKFIVFCAFTFDPEAAKDIDEINWPGVTLLKAQMNTDLLTEDLKKARSSNESFWLMGQPDAGPPLRLPDGSWHVEVRGFDYFDPRSGELISGGASKIAMWSLDTDYDGRSLMPHQVFFPMAGANDGWNRLKKTVRAELDEDLLKQFHGTVSLPFEAGDHNRVAVKIVDDRGIESLKIMNLE